MEKIPILPVPFEEVMTVYPPINNNWSNEVGETFTADEDDLNEDGWLDPWSRPIPMDKLSEYRSCRHSNIKFRFVSVPIGPDRWERTITLEIYKLT